MEGFEPVSHGCFGVLKIANFEGSGFLGRKHTYSFNLYYYMVQNALLRMKKKRRSVRVHFWPCVQDKVLTKRPHMWFKIFGPSFSV